jgi:hypothetical protein
VRSVFLALILLLAPSALAFDAPPASPLLPPDHWAVKAADRLEELGLVDRYMPAQRAVPLLAVQRALAEAEERARAVRPDVASLVKAWRERFDQEWSGAAKAPEGPRILGGQLAGGYRGGSVHEARPPATRPSAVRLEVPRSDPFAEADAAAAWGAHLAIGARVHATPWQADVPSVELVGALGPVALSVGKTQVGYGPNEIGGIVASGTAAVERVELMTTAPVRLPGLLGALGDFSLDTVLARFDESRHPYHPLLWEFNLQWRPHPRLTLGALRGVMFGGALWEGISRRDIPLALFGIKNYRENNVYSASARYRLPTDRVLPLTAKLEWGSDDNPAAAVQWPGLVMGLTAPMLPGLPASLGFEYAYFGKGPFGYHDPFGWYDHGLYAGGWATHQTPLGDPLGGNGKAFRLTASADPFEARLHVAAMGWVQDRFADDLYAPAAGGRSVGGSGEAELRLGRGSLGLRGSYEHGWDGWSRKQIEVAGKVFF